MTDYVFQVKSIDDIIRGYEAQGAQENDKDGKNFWWHIENELKERRTSREELIDIIVGYVRDNNTTDYAKIRDFLKETYKHRN